MSNKARLNHMNYTAQLAELGTRLDECIALLKQLATHTHEFNGAAGGIAYTSQPRSNTQTYTGGVALTAPAPADLD